MDLPKINAFLVAADCLSFTETAVRLHSTQSTVSKQISFLEREWELTLFERSNGRLSLTPAGMVLREQLSSMMQILEDGLSMARRLQEDIKGTLHIGCFENMDPGVLMEVMTSRFLKKHPHIEVNLEMYSSREVISALEENRLDIGLVKEFDIETIPGYEIFPVGKGEPCLIIGKSHPKGRELMTMEEARDLPFIVVSQAESPNSLRQVMDNCRAYGFKPHIASFVPNTRTLFLYVDAGMGVTISDRAFTAAMNHNLRFIPLTQAEPANNVLVWKTATTNPAVALFMEEMKAYLRQH